MLKIQVQYFLSTEGQQYFPTWFNEVHTATKTQDGFISLHTDYDESHPTVYLCFQNLEKLQQWKEQALHNELASKIETYFVQPKQVVVHQAI